MADPDKRQPDAKPAGKRDDADDRKRYDEQVEESFPASDPPADAQPGGGITGPNPSRERGDKR